MNLHARLDPSKKSASHRKYIIFRPRCDFRVIYIIVPLEGASNNDSMKIYPRISHRLPITQNLFLFVYRDMEKNTEKEEKKRVTAIRRI